jgi:hypothetical protein
VIVMDDGGKVECLVSQSDVLCLLEECIKSAYPRLADKVLALIVSFRQCLLLPLRSPNRRLSRSWA